ncbi:helicase SNF2 [Williamsia sp. 1138]|uniref:DEAD/DEAH box helicase n=1 Tax=Williamsia sp. 1138 TaxID=1903117 RepID=UPI000A110E40|nr:DEAD/DEAH box helicase [Williamsia sp. 1138]OZG26359.1 helicase SNF2 [Williamsia sp. 1138]
MFSSWAHSITAERLAPTFGANVVTRGEEWLRDGSVTDLAWEGGSVQELSGTCVGPDGDRNDVTISFASVGERWSIGRAICTCPVRMWCKHGAALLLTAAQPADEDRTSSPSWESVATSIISESAPGQSGKALALLVSVDQPAPRSDDGPSIRLLPVTVDDDGMWVRTGISWRVVGGPDVHGEFDAGQFRALQRLAQTDDGLLGSSPHSHLDLTKAPAAIWSALEDVLAAGIPLIADTSSLADHVAIAKRAVLGLDIGPSETPASASLKAHMIVDDEAWNLADTHLFGAPTAHGVFRVVDRVLTLAPFDPVPPNSLLQMARSKLTSQIPVADADHFMNDVLPRLQASVPVRVAPGLFEPPDISGPTPVLIVTTSDEGARVHWSVRYSVNGEPRDSDPSKRIPSGSHRSKSAEGAVWQQIDDVLRAVVASSDTWPQQARDALDAVPTASMTQPMIKEFHALRAAEGVDEALAAASLRTLWAGVTLSEVEAARFYVEVLPQIVERDDIIVELSEELAGYRRADSAAQLQFSAPDAQTVGNDWFDLRITVTVDGEQVPLAALIRELTAGATYMLLPSGTYFALDTPELTRLVELLAEGRALGELDGDQAKASSFNVPLWEELLELGIVDDQTRAWQQNLARLRSARPPVAVEPPEMLHAEVRPYQLDGLNWLTFLWDNGLGGILADDMGLGKTLQTLALIGRIREAGESTKPFLVVAPTSVIANWLAECEKFTPDLTAVAVTASEAKSRGSLQERIAGADIVITSYTLLRIDFPVFDDVEWGGLILDEAQFVKNHKAKAHQCARRLSTPFKLAITGTPMENNLMELWSLLSITAPGLFAKPKQFTEFFRRPIESGAHPERLATLRRRIKPVMLRRTKDQVATDLPPKQEQVVPVTLIDKHQKIYDTRLARERQKVLGLLGDWERNRFEIFRSLTMLRQLSLHAGLVDPTKRDVPSAKVEFLEEHLPELIAEGHSALVFSQFTGFLAIIREHLDAAQIPYSYLDGSMTARQRTEAIMAFSAGTTKVFLISLKAGGFGLNLTEADYVYVCDPWWNPAAEAQAVDRAHRIGQTRPVTVYRLVSAGTIEEKVVALQDRKRELFSAVMDEGEMFGSAIGVDDIRELLG